MEIENVLLTRPERVSHLEDPLLDRLASMAAGRTVALVEVAGRDSVAASAYAARSGAFQLMVPTIAYTGTEHGDWTGSFENAVIMMKMAEGTGTVVATEPVVLGSPRWWHAVAGRYSGLLQSHYGFATTCVACHMYLHAVRVPLAHRIGATAIISGERLSHDRRTKLNQVSQTLGAYRSVLAGQGVDLDLPLESVSSWSEVLNTVGPLDDTDSGLSCVLEGNYREADGDVQLDSPALSAYLVEFLVPFTEHVLKAFQAGGDLPDYLGTADEVIEGLVGP